VTHDDPTLVQPADDDIVSRRAPLARRFALWAPLQVPPERRSVRFDELALSARCQSALGGQGFATLEDLDGLTLVDVFRRTGCRHPQLRELCFALVKLGILNDPRPAVARPANVPRFAAEYLIDELPLGLRCRNRLRSTGFTLLGEFDGATPSQLARVGRPAVRELSALVENLIQAGAPEPQGLFDALDAALDDLRDAWRHVVLLRFGADGRPPMTFAQIGSGLERTGSRMGLVVQSALRALPILAGPEFGPALRDLQRDVSLGADLASELARVGRNPSLSVKPRRWGSSSAFYERLIVALAPIRAPHLRVSDPTNAPRPEPQRRTRERRSRPSAPRPKAMLTFQGQIDALMESLVDSVMRAIRNAPLEKVLGEDVLGPIVASVPSEVERSPRTEHRRRSKRVAKHPRPLASSDAPASAEAVPEDVGSAADILDPEMVLGVGVPLQATPGETGESRAPRQDGQGRGEEAPDGAEVAESTHHMHLRDNETVARVSNAGIVLRRSRVTATNGSSS
jgi:hypothetical protein